MKLIFKLLFAEARQNPGRLVPGMVAMCVSVALVVWMMGNFDSLVKEFDHEADAYMGTYSLCVAAAPGKDRAALPQTLIDRLAADPAVNALDIVEQIRLPIGKNEQGKSFDDFIRERMGIPSQSPILVGTDAVDCPYELEEGRWPDMKNEKGDVGVLGSASAAFFNVKPGDSLYARSGDRVAEIRIVGIVHQLEAHPDISSSLRQGAGPALSSLFVPVALFEKINGKPLSPNLLNIQLKEGFSVQDFKNNWVNQPEFADAVFADTEAVQNRLNDNRSVRRMKDSASSAAGMVLFACVFIIFTTLSMGVTERAKKLALLRALGLSKKQIAGLVVWESVLLSVPAFLLGCVAGLILLQITAPEGLVSRIPLPSWQTLVLAFLCSTGGGVIASLIPAWRATRVAPLEASVDQWASSAVPGQGRPILMGVIGILCWCIQPAVLWLPGLEPETRKTLFTWLGYPGLLAGAILLSPAIIFAAEKLFYRPIALLMKINPLFLKSQLTVNMVRTAGTTIALTIGLGLYMAVQIWGYSMVVPFKIDKSMPDTLVSFLHTGFSGDSLKQVMKQAPLDGQGMYPIIVEEPDIARKQLESPDFHSIKQKSVVLTGIPLDQMMTGEKASLTPEFKDGSLEDALRKMKAGRALLIPDTFAVAANLKTGDFLYLTKPGTRGEVQKWEIAGVVYMPGWHWLTKTSGMRVRRGHFIAALTIADERQVASSFGVDSVRFFWGNSNDQRPSGEQQDTLQDYLAKQQTDPMVKPLVKVTSSRELSNRVGGMADRAIDSMSNLPLIALLIGSLALMNTVLAAVNARKEEFRLMHAVGVTKGMLYRMVLGESLLIGLTAVVLSFLFGVIAAWGSIEVLRYGYAFGGVTPPLDIPWLHLLYGAGITLFLCLIPLLLVRLGKRQY